MTVARRNALAAAWLKEGAASSSNATSSAAHLAAARAASADEINASSSSNSSDGSYDEAADNEETWMVLEFCDKGSLQRALLQGRFKRRDSQQPDMVSSTAICRVYWPQVHVWSEHAGVCFQAQDRLPRAHRLKL